MVTSDFIERLEVRNEDVMLCFTCPNYSKRIRECVSNLMVIEEQPETLIRKQAFYGQTDDEVVFRKGHLSIDSDDNWVTQSGTLGWDAFFFFG